MKIKTKLQMSIVFTLIMIIVIPLIFRASQLKTEELEERRKLDRTMIKGMSELKSVTLDYLLHEDERARTQWQVRFESLQRLATERKSIIPENIEILDNVREDLDVIRDIFLQLEASHDRLITSGKGYAEKDVENMLVSQLMIRTDAIINNTLSIQKNTSAQAFAEQQRANLVIIAFLGMLAILMTTNTLVLRRNIVRPLLRLREGTELVAGGDLTYRVGISNNDEIGDLSQAFDEMTLKLQKSYGNLTNEIDERKRVEEELRESEARLRATLRSTADEIWIVDTQGRIVSLSDSVMENLGVNSDKLADVEAALDQLEILRPDGTPMPREDAILSRTLLGEVIRNEGEIVRHLATGQLRWREVAGSPIRDAESRIIGAVAVVRDITERKRAEEMLRESEERFRVLMTASSNVVYRMNPDWSVMRQLKGQNFIADTEDPNCNWLQEYIHPDDQSHVKATINEAIRTKSTFELKHRVLRVDGSLGWTFSRAVPLLDASGKIVEWFGAASDITERIQDREALKTMNEELEERVAQRTAELREKDQMLLLQSRHAAMGEMIGNIAHQWRQPLNTLGLTIQQMELYYNLGEFTKEFLEKSASSSMNLIHHMSKTIDDFRNYFEPCNEKSEFKASEAIANTLSLIEDSSKNQHIEIVTNSDPVIHGYQNEFAQVLLNILINAKDVSTERKIEKPRVTITIGTENGHAVVTIADNAGGIPDEIMGKVFDPYFTTKGPQQGTGVGLFMSKTIIEKNMEGNLSVCNDANGAVFRIEI